MHHSSKTTKQISKDSMLIKGNKIQTHRTTLSSVIKSKPLSKSHLNCLHYLKCQTVHHVLVIFSEYDTRSTTNLLNWNVKNEKMLPLVNIK